MKVKVYAGGYLPERAHFDDAGIDFRTPEAFSLAAFDSAVIDLKVAVQIPIGYCGLMFPKSGLNVKASVITHRCHRQRIQRNHSGSHSEHGQ